jgi:hypothetical protein
VRSHDSQLFSLVLRLLDRFLEAQFHVGELVRSLCVDVLLVFKFRSKRRRMGGVGGEYVRGDRKSKRREQEKRKMFVNLLESGLFFHHDMSFDSDVTPHSHSHSFLSHRSHNYYHYRL